jgi:hypothetical protein
MTQRSVLVRRWTIVAIYAVAMAWVEAACVYYIRMLVNRVDPHQVNPLPISGSLGAIEIAREASTLIMLLMIGALAGRTWRTRLGYTAIAFGVWDIAYYAFLKMMSGWPTSILDWDILFLIPLPWWGPVLAPICVALLMIVGGTLVCHRVSRGSTMGTVTRWTLTVVGIALALYVFMRDAIHVLPRGADAVQTVLPRAFDWTLFTVALALMAAPVAQELRRSARL